MYVKIFLENVDMKEYITIYNYTFNMGIWFLDNFLGIIKE